MCESHLIAGAAANEITTPTAGTYHPVLTAGHYFPTPTVEMSAKDEQDQKDQPEVEAQAANCRFGVEQPAEAEAPAEVEAHSIRTGHIINIDGEAAPAEVEAHHALASRGPAAAPEVESHNAKPHGAPAEVEAQNYGGNIAPAEVEAQSQVSKDSKDNEDAQVETQSAKGNI
jgi:hypothetical protein